jgi:hypothetical protein
MGLDITAYRQLAIETDVETDDHGWPVDYDIYWRPGASLGFSEGNWPGRAKGLPGDEDTIFSYGESYGFRAGSYSGYNDWRDWLARVAGWPNADDAWAHEKDLVPLFTAFHELINFADNEGVIGPEVSAKLAKDFADNQAKAQSMDDTDGYYYNRYQCWQRAFEMAADGGAVDFH